MLRRTTQNTQHTQSNIRTTTRSNTQSATTTRPSQATATSNTLPPPSRVVYFLQNPHTRLAKLIIVTSCATFALLFANFLSHFNFWLITPLPPLRFCRVPTLETTDTNLNPIDIPNQCTGDEYELFAKEMHNFAANRDIHDSTWGRRLKGGIPAHKRVLVLGNLDTQQIAYALACQYAAKVHHISPTAQSLQFPRNASAVLLTDSGESLRNVAADQFGAAVQAQTGFALDDFDAIVWGLLIDCGLASEACPNTTATLFFGAAEQFTGPMIFIGMMADARQEQAFAIRDQVRTLKSQGHRHLLFIMGRRYISKITLEGAFSNGEADNAHKTGKVGHRCAGAEGGHADLLAFDVSEFLHQQLD